MSTAPTTLTKSILRTHSLSERSPLAPGSHSPHDLETGLHPSHTADNVEGDPDEDEDGDIEIDPIQPHRVRFLTSLASAVGIIGLVALLILGGRELGVGKQKGGWPGGPP